MNEHPSIELLRQLKAALKQMGVILDRIDADLKQVDDGREGF